jgi:hypothetical protein
MPDRRRAARSGGHTAQSAPGAHPHYDVRMPGDVEIQTIWRTAAEHCELVWGRFTGCRLRLWVRNRLVLEEPMFDAETAVKRAWELRIEWPRLVE